MTYNIGWTSNDSKLQPKNNRLKARLSFRLEAQIWTWLGLGTTRLCSASDRLRDLLEPRG